jgi:hypothetical protein
MKFDWNRLTTLALYGETDPKTFPNLYCKAKQNHVRGLKEESIFEKIFNFNIKSM